MKKKIWTWKKEGIFFPERENCAEKIWKLVLFLIEAEFSQPPRYVSNNYSSTVAIQHLGYGEIIF